MAKNNADAAAQLRFEEYEVPGWVNNIETFNAVIKNLAQFVAIYSLLYFEKGAGKLLHPISPTPKFIVRWTV